MTEKTIKLKIPFQVLTDFIEGLSLQDQRRLWEWLDERIAQAEEALWEQDTTIRAEIREARAAYQSGDYITLDEYIAQEEET